MKDEDTRLDRAMAILKASVQAGCDADRWTVVSKSISGFELTGASEDVRSAIESYGVSCNAIMQPYQTSAAECTGDFNEADAARLVDLSRQLAECIRDAESNRILARFRDHVGELPEAEIIEARRHRAWFAPLLLHECQAAIDTDGESGGDKKDQHNSIPFFSLFLFSEWQVVDSVPIVLQGLKLPGEGPFDLFGDGVHEQVPRYLAQFMPGELDRIDDLIRSPGGNLYVRWASVGSYMYLVRDRAVSLDDAVQRLDRLFNETKVIGEDGRPGMGHPYEVSSGIIEVITSIGGTSRSTMSDSDQDWDFVDESIFDRREFGETSVQDDSSELSGELLNLPPTCLGDCVEALRHWAAFAPIRKPTPRPPTPRPGIRVQPKTIQPADQSVPPPKAITVRNTERVPRNSKCPCGSGKKYKKCCLRQTID